MEEAGIGNVNHFRKFENLHYSCISSNSYLQINPRLKTLTSQETPFVGVEDRSDYLRGGNVKLDDQSLGLPYLWLSLLRSYSISTNLHSDRKIYPLREIHNQDIPREL